MFALHLFLIFVMKPPLISVITPTYNRADLLQRCIESVLAQTYTNWEYIVIDDGSTDSTSTMIQKYLHDARIRYIQKINTGAADTRNIGVSHANGDLITFLDSDDEALPEWLSNVAEAIYAADVWNKNIGMISVGARRYFRNSTTEEMPYPIRMYGSTLTARLTCGCFFFTKKNYEAIGGYDVSIKSGMQTELGLRLLRHTHENGEQILSVYKCLVKIYVHEGVRMRNDWRTLVHDTSLMLQKLYNYYYDNDKKQLSNNYAVLAYYQYRAEKKRAALVSLLKAIKFRPFYFTNYARAIKYSIQ
jgi:glycosyltransferase involved in cell wall biosynthesis